jgi:hypothetical protein
VDHECPEASAFANAAHRVAFTKVCNTGHDLGPLWINELEPQLKRERIALAGFTNAATLFCLELLARDYGVGVVYRIEHQINRGGTVRHRLIGPQSLAHWEQTLAQAGPLWPAVAADVAITCPPGLAASPDIGAAATPVLDRQSSGFSWVMARMGPNA